MFLLFQGVRIYGVECGHYTSDVNFYQTLADMTYGKHLKLEQFPTIVDIMLAICYGETGAEYFEVCCFFGSFLIY